MLVWSEDLEGSVEWDFDEWLVDRSPAPDVDGVIVKGSMIL